MPILLILALLVGTGYHHFFRFDHWVNPDRPGVTYERDNLTGHIYTLNPEESLDPVTHVVGLPNDPQAAAAFPKGIQPKTLNLGGLLEGITQRRVALRNSDEATERDTTRQTDASHSNNPLSRLWGKVKDSQEHSTSHAQPARISYEASPYTEKQKQLLPPLAKSNPTHTEDDSISMALRPHPASLPPLVSTTTKSLPTQLTPSTIKQTVDLNHDGQLEQLLLQPLSQGKGYQFRILNNQQEIFYGTGKALEVTQRIGQKATSTWQTLSLETLDGKEQWFWFNPKRGLYESLSSASTSSNGN